MAINPNEGTRNWDSFVKLSANGAPIEVTYAPLTFRTDTGERPTDEWLVTDGYVGYINPGAPNYNKFIQKVIKTPLNQLPIVNNVITQTYTVDTLEGAELEAGNARYSTAVNAERERRIELGCDINVDGVGPIPIRGTSEDMRNLTNLGQVANMSLISGNNTPIPFRDNDNVMHMLTPSQMSQLWQKAITYVSMVYQASWVIKAASPRPYDFDQDKYWPTPGL